MSKHHYFADMESVGFVRVGLSHVTDDAVAELQVELTNEDAREFARRILNAAHATEMSAAEDEAA